MLFKQSNLCNIQLPLQDMKAFIEKYLQLRQDQIQQKMIQLFIHPEPVEGSSNFLYQINIAKAYIAYQSLSMDSTGSP